VLGEGQVKLEISSMNFLVLDGVYHIYDIRRKNLIGTSLLVQHGYKVVFESNRVVITRHSVFVGKDYICDGLFKLSLMPLSIDKISSISSFVANVECSYMWHARLGHVNLNSIKRMMSLNLIPKASIDLKQKCETCIQAKQPRKRFTTFIERETNLLELVHSDSNDVLTHGGKRYFITFFDDFSKYCYVYLVNHKSELFNKFKVYKTEVENQLKKIKILYFDRDEDYTFRYE